MARTYTFPGVAVITGAGGTGIGAAIARGFASAGCDRIAITDLNPTSLDETKQAILSSHPQAHLVVRAGNIADEQFVDSFIAEVAHTFGRLDYAVNCAGIFGDALRSTEMSTETFDQINNVNYRGCWLSSRAELRQMIKQEPLPSHDPSRSPQRGAVVNIASQLGMVGRPKARESMPSFLSLSRSRCVTVV